MTRGERNNNPGNIIADGTAWLGLIDERDRTDDRFCQFTAPEYGIRALMRILISYVHHDDVDTLRDVIARWAPASENDTAAYTADVSQRTGLAPSDLVEVDHRPTLLNLARAIIHHENGEDIYDDATYDKAIKMLI